MSADRYSRTIAFNTSCGVVLSSNKYIKAKFLVCGTCVFVTTHLKLTGANLTRKKCRYKMPQGFKCYKAPRRSLGLATDEFSVHFGYCLYLTLAISLCTSRANPLLERKKSGLVIMLAFSLTFLWILVAGSLE